MGVYCSMKTNNAILLPVIIGDQRISNMPTSISLMSKLKYDPKKTYMNFWKNLMKSFNIHDLTEEELKINFDIESCSTILEHVEPEVDITCTKRRTSKIKFPFIS